MADVSAPSGPDGRRIPALVFLSIGILLGRGEAGAQAASPAEAAESARMPGVPFEELARRGLEEWDAGPSHAAEALRYFRAGVELDPRWADGWWHIGLIEFNLGRFAGARAALARLVALVPESGPGWSLLGLCDFRLDDHERALDELLNGRRLVAPSADSLGQESARTLAWLLVRHGHSAAAGQELARLLARGDDPELLTACGLYALQMKLLPGEVPDAERDLVQRVGRATAAALALRSDEARAAFADALVRYPRARGLHFLYGRFLAMEASAGAGEWFRKELELFPDHAEALVEVALDDLEHDRTAEALASARAAARLSPDAVWPHYALGRALVATGATADGVAELERALAGKPGDPDLLLALAQAYARDGRTADVERVKALLLAVPAHREPRLLR